MWLRSLVYGDKRQVGMKCVTLHSIVECATLKHGGGSIWDRATP